MATDIKLDVDGGDTLVLEGTVIAMRGRLNLLPLESDEDRSRAISEARIGDLVMLVSEQEGALGMRFSATELWLCVPPETPAAATHMWRKVQLEPAVPSP